MALVHIDHVPKTVKVNIPLNIILPDPGEMQDIPVARRKVLYLLHGLGDDASAWQRYTSIEILAATYGLVVVMPSAGRSFYTDLPNGQAYFSYLVQELPQYLADAFGISPQRSDTLIAGNSMGGYGAMKAALLHPERYSVAASFSGALSLEFLRAFPHDPRRPEFELIFGDLRKLSGGPHDPATWLQHAALDPAGLPHLWLSCARQEDVYPLSGIFYQACRSLGIDASYHEEDGKHDWNFWDVQIHRFLSDYLTPLR